MATAIQHLAATLARVNGPDGQPFTG